MALATIETQHQTFESEPPFRGYVAVGDIPELAGARLGYQVEAEALHRERNQLLQNDQLEKVPLPVDPLSEAKRVIEAGLVYGEDSQEYIQSKAGFLVSCKRLVGEWFRKYSYEYFEGLEHEFDHENQDFYSHGYSILDMTRDGIIGSGETEKVDRRINEHVEQGTSVAIQGLGSLALGQTVQMRTVSECADWALRDYERDQKAGITTGGYEGYVPEIRKLMIRDMVMNRATGKRTDEVVALPGTYIDHWVITEALRHRGLESAHLSKDKTELQGTQLLVDDDIMEFVAILDQVASENYAVDVFMGEKIEPGTVKNYALARQQAIKRQKSLQNQSETIAMFVLDLAEEETDSQKAVKLVEEFVKKMLLTMADQNNGLAAPIFGEDTARGLREVAWLRTNRGEDEAFARLQEVAEAAPGGGYCGAGSCGLESVKPGSLDAKKIEDLGFDPKNTIKDTERKCVNCKKKKVVYDTKQGKKGCTGCRATAKY